MLSWSETARRPGERRARWSDRLDGVAEIGPRPVLERLVGYGKRHPTERWCMSPLPWHLGAHWVKGSEKQRWLSPKAGQGQRSLAFSQALTLHTQMLCCEGGLGHTQRPHGGVWTQATGMGGHTNTARHRGKKPFEMTLTQMTLSFSMKDRLSKPPS